MLLVQSAGPDRQHISYQALCLVCTPLVDFWHSDGTIYIGVSPQIPSAQTYNMNKSEVINFVTHLDVHEQKDQPSLDLSIIPK